MGHMRDTVVPGLRRPAYGTKASAAGERVAFEGAQSALSVLTDVARSTEHAASRGQRFAARLVDVVCFAVLLAAGQAVLWTVLVLNDPRLRPLVLGGSPLTEQQGAALDGVVASWTWLVSLVTLVLWFLYEVPLTVLRGQTLGKMAVGIRVVTADPTTVLGWRAVLGRWAVLGLPGLLGVFGLPLQAVDCAWILRRAPRPQCLHDRLAKTYVIAKPPR